MPESVTVTCDVKVLEVNPRCVSVLVNDHVVAYIEVMRYVETSIVAGFLHNKKLYQKLERAVAAVLQDWVKAVQDNPPDLFGSDEDDR